MYITVNTVHKGNN